MSTDERNYGIFKINGTFDQDELILRQAQDDGFGNQIFYDETFELSQESATGDELAGAV